MSRISRRDWMERALGVMAAGSASGAWSAVMGAEEADSDAAIKLCLIRSIEQPHLIKLARQIGITYSIAGTASALSKVPRSPYVDAVSQIKEKHATAGMTIAAIPCRGRKSNSVCPGATKRSRITSPPWRRSAPLAFAPSVMTSGPESTATAPARMNPDGAGAEPWL